MQIVDSHTHVWVNKARFPWPEQNANPPAEDRSAEMLLALMSAHGVDRTVLVQVIHYRWDNRYVVDCIHRYPDRFMGVGRVDPEDRAAADHLSEWVEQGIHGVRLSPAVGDAGDWFANDDLMEPIFARAEALQVPLLLLTRPPRLRDLAGYLDRHPDLDVVIDHMADCDPTDAAGRRLLTDLARYPRVTVKISHTWSSSQQAYPWTDTHDLVRAVYQAFGGRRLMWGTDWPVCLSRAQYGQTLSVVRDHFSCFIAAPDMEWVLGRTAQSLWPFGA